MKAHELSRTKDLVPYCEEKKAIAEVGNAIYNELLKIAGTSETLKLSEHAYLLCGLPYDRMAFLLLCAYLGRLAMKEWYIFAMTPVVDAKTTGYSTVAIAFTDIEMKLCPMMEPGLVSAMK